MPSVELPFATQEGKSAVTQNSRETLVNMFSEIEVDARRRLIRRQRAALESVVAQLGEKRCIEDFGAFHYCIIGSTFYKFDGTTLTSLGTIGSNVGRCTMIVDDNGKILISDGTTAYYWNGTIITTMSFPTAVGHLTFQGGFGIYNSPGTGQFYVTGVNALNTVDPLDFATAESAPDPIIRCFVDHNELWLFGTDTTEIWQLSGGTDFPFTPFVNSQMERGCAAAFSVAKEDNTVFWLGDDLVVYRADGYRPQRISTHPIERLIAAIPAAVRALADAVIYTIGGHKFYTLRFPDYGTVQFNIATNLWNQAKSYGFEDWRILGSAGQTASYVMTAAGICRLSTAINQDESGIIRRSAISAPIYAKGKRILIRSFTLDCEVGRAAIGVEPQVMLRVARDAETFGNERWRSIGATGAYTRRVTWRNLGFSRKPALEFACTDDVNFAVVGSDGDLVVATS